mmetsp:Transcript_1641/g.3423  ORF Transcript_1641/g.3423 Transcript_1641/m.3423 type:complete len:557 (+) Transcript_1641:2-1672(+)
MFVSGVILGVIVSLNDDRGVVVVEGKDDEEGVNSPPAPPATMAKKMGVPCQGPLLRDIAVLSLVCIVSMSYLERGVVDYGFVYTLLAMYFVYVLTVLGADAYHLLYHLPRVRRSESGVSLCSNSGGGGGGVSTIEVGKGSDDKCCGGSQGQDQDVATAASVREQLAVNEQTPLVATSSGDSSHHLHNRHHSLPVHTHSIRDTVIEAMSNYTCDEEHEQEEQIVIFHPHHAVHPHHENGPMFLSNVFRRGDALRRGSTNSVSPKPSRSRSARQAIRKTVSDGITSFHSWSNSDSARDKNQNSGVSSSSLSSPPEVKRLSSPDRLTTVISSSPPLNITSRSSVDEECAQPSLLKSCNNNEENNNNNNMTSIDDNNDEDYENEPPLLEELGVNFPHIYSKSRAVLFPIGKHAKSLEAGLIEDDADLAGPLAFALGLGGELVLVGKMHFGYVYGFGLSGCLAMTLLLNLLNPNGAVSMWTVVSILGYALLPVNLLAGINILYRVHKMNVVGMALAVLIILWCTAASTRLFERGCQMRDQRFLVAYPAALLYSAFVMITIF